MREVLTSALFWVGLIQWTVLFPLVLVCQIFFIRRSSLLLEIVLEIIVLVLVAAIVIFVPLHLIDHFPLPSGRELNPYKYGFVLGALFSVLLRRFLKRRLLTSSKL